MENKEIKKRLLILAIEGETLDPEESEKDFFRMEEIFKEISKLALQIK